VYCKEFDLKVSPVQTLTDAADSTLNIELLVKDLIGWPGRYTVGITDSRTTTTLDAWWQLLKKLHSVTENIYETPRCSNVDETTVGGNTLNVVFK
jgi:hypothetical protein